MTQTGPTTVKGHSVASGMTGGLPWDPSEPVPALSWPLNIAVYDQMRRGDPKVKSVLNAVSLPCRRATWELVPNGAPEEAVALLAEDLGLPIRGAGEPSARRRGRDRFSWSEHVRLALLSLAYGHMPFEKVGAIVDGRWRMLRLDERLPPTIQKINVERNGDLAGVVQYPSGGFGSGTGDEILAPSLVFYSREREGGIWQGNSILRTAYKHWLIKDRLLRVDAMKHERNGMGIPIAKAPVGASERTIQQINEIMSRWRVGEGSGAAFPAGTEIELKGVSGSLPDTLASIRYHDEQIGEEALTQFLDLGTTETGSRALGQAFVDFFTLSLGATVDELAATFNTMLVESWVDWNYGAEVSAPFVECRDVGEDHAVTAEALAGLVQAKVITPDTELEAWLRRWYRLPEADEATARDVDPVGSAVQAARRGRRVRLPRPQHDAY